MGNKVKIKDVAKKSDLKEEVLRETFFNQGIIEDKEAKYVDKNKIVYFTDEEMRETGTRKIMFYEKMGSGKIAYLALAFMMLAGAYAAGIATQKGGNDFNTASFETVIEQIETDTDMLAKVQAKFCK